MTTQAHSDLAFTLTNYYFGSDVAQVIKALFNYDQASLRLLKYDLPHMKLNELKRALLILVKYQLVDYVKSVKNFTHQFEYSVVSERVFSFFSSPKFIQMAGLREGSPSGPILHCLTVKALLSTDRLISQTLDMVKKTTHEVEVDEAKLQTQIEDHVAKLITKGYVVQTGKNLCLNFGRFDRDFRDDLVIETVYKYYNNETKVKSLCKSILYISTDNTADDHPLTAPVPLGDIVNSVVPNDFANRTLVEKCLDKLTTENNNRFFVTCGQHQERGPMYAVDVGAVIDYLVKEHLSSMITSKFGPKCCRVFRVLLSRGHLLLKQIEEIIMLPVKDVREYTYMLMKEGFIRNRQVPKTPDNAPGKSVFIMSVDMDQLVFSATDLCCRAINNLLVRYEFELSTNKSLLDRSKEFLDSGAGQDEWNQYFTSHELSQLDMINRTINKILMAKVQVTETLFLLHTWVKINNINSSCSTSKK